jgi:predicted dehydrogenase
MGRRHAENLRRLVPQARLVAVADAVLRRAREVAADLEIENAYDSLEEMLECKGLDAVIIATPDKFHVAAVELAAGAGKDILCEKPLALNLADAHSALKAVSKSGVRFQVGFMRRYDIAYADAMKRVAKEEGVPLVDLHARSMAMFGRLGDKSSASFSASAADRTHFSDRGAREIARLVADALGEVEPTLSKCCFEARQDAEVLSTGRAR